MTAEQLRAARREYWRQDGNPLLTSEEVSAWFDRHSLNLFLPRRAQLPAPAPSFVEAVEGKADSTPALTVVEGAGEMLAGVIESGAVIPLNLLGGVGEQPDFLAQTEILSVLASLRGDRDWKQAPASAGGRRVSPLMLELWELLEREGPSTAAAAREKLGRELTDSAVLRALSELWQRLRAIPVPQAGGKPAVWELLKQRHSSALAAGSGTSQVTAISLLVSIYLQSVYAASGEEMEVFLSPLVSRSRIREAVRGLSATRQIQSLSMETQTYYFLEGGLPEFAAVAVPEGVGEEAAAAAAGGDAEAATQRETTQDETRRPAAKFSAPPSGAASSPRNFRPAVGRVASEQSRAQRANRVPGRFTDRRKEGYAAQGRRAPSEGRSPNRSQGGGPNQFRDRPQGRPQDRSQGRFKDRFGDHLKNRRVAGPGQPLPRAPKWQRQDDAREQREPGEYRPPVGPPKGRWTREGGRETTGGPMRRQSPKGGWRAQPAASRPQGQPQGQPGGGKWRRFSDLGGQSKPRNPGKSTPGKAYEPGRPSGYGEGAGRPFRPGKPKERGDRPKDRPKGGAGVAPGKSRRQFGRNSRTPNAGGLSRRSQGPRDQDANRGMRAPDEGFRPKPKWQKGGAKPQSMPGREAGSRARGPSDSPESGAGKFVARKPGSGKFSPRSFGSRPSKTGGRPGGQVRQPGFRGKKSQASFPGKKWPKKKPEA